MIAWLRGRLAAREQTRAILDVQGVGYEVFAPNRTIDLWTASAEAVEAHISTHVREDAITLYGFGSATDRQAFEVLLSVSGIGPKLALACLDAAPLAQLTRAIEGEDAAALSRIPGIGKKTAQRLILELKGKMPASFEPNLPKAAPPAPPPEDLLIGALSRLGYSRSEIDRVNAQLERDEVPNTAPVAERLRRALQVLYRSDA
jgi:Holliday junction DNA helicase RuvA